MTLRMRAMLRLLGAPRDDNDPVARADNRTSVDDARAALSVACGAPLDRICPCGGYDLRDGSDG